MSENFLQKENINYITTQFGKELWVQVCGKSEMNGADGYFWAGLIPNNEIEIVLEKADWELNDFTCASPGFISWGDRIEYDRFSGSKYEPLIYCREFSGIKPSYIEISEEFRLLNNLYFDVKSNQYMEITDNGDVEIVVKLEGDNVFIKLNYLKRFITAKQMGLALYFDIKFDSIKTLGDMGYEPFDERHCGSDYCFDYYYDNDTNATTKTNSYSIIRGKKILLGMDIEDCGYPPFNKDKVYEEFIIGIDEEGKEVRFTSNPAKVSNVFGTNDGATYYLTPIYFSKDVLAKYYLKPELYEVNDGYIRCQWVWKLDVDNLNKDYVSVYLGDLGQVLPHKEQVYWKSFNVVPDGELSKAKFKRDFLAEFADADIADIKFKQIFTEIKKKWYKRYEWNLFIDLSEGDKYNFEHLRIPILNSQVEFDNLVLSLVKTILDSLNEKELKKRIVNKDELKGSISILQRFFEEKEIIGYELHIKFLRSLQELRSTGSGHRKGNSYNKICKFFNLEDGNFADVFEKILEDAILFIEFLDEKFIIAPIVE